MVTEAQKRQFEEQGYVVLKGLFPREECDAYIEHYMNLRSEERPGDFSGVDPKSNDPLKRYPRMINMHRWDDVSMKWLIDSRLNEALTELLGQEPYPVQTMLYYKPAGARGQALHQDQFYLRVQPGTCVAAWMALERIDEENGCMQVVPGTQNLPVLCTKTADTSQSFTDVTVPIPDGLEPVPVLMDPGDVLFFNGSVIHGSYPNTSKDRFRRSLIGHYATGDAQALGEWYRPVYNMRGEVVEHLGVTPGATECGVWVEEDGSPNVRMRQLETAMPSLHE
ncbi:MAG TPA: phytanoyl-CoA dioxygenase family protein [Fimbriimonas sp.]